MVTDDQRRRSKAIQQRTGRTFHLATRFLPERVRDPTYVLYAFFRTADDVVDDPDPGRPAAQRRELDRLRAAALGERDTTDPVLSAVSEVRDRHDIPAGEFEAFIEAMAADVDTRRYGTHAELETYLRGSAVAVANMMLAVMDPTDAEAARPHARALGQAFQLTNFLRDVREDVTTYDRIYLPGDLLTAHGVAPAQIRALEHSEGLAAAIRTALRRTEDLYRDGVAGIARLPADCQFPVLLSAVLYAEHHRLIRERDYDVISARPVLGTPASLRAVARTWWHWRRERDPESAFYLASAVPERNETGHATGSATQSRAAGRLLRPLRSAVGSYWPLGRPEGP